MIAVKSSTEPKIHLDEPVLSLLRMKDRSVWHISPDSTVFEAIEQMAEKGIGALVVLQEGRLVGLISERDYARKVILKSKRSQETFVSEIMTTPVLFIGPANSVSGAMRIMTDHRVRHLPVLEGDRVVGVLSIGDLVNWIIRSHEETIRQLQSYITGAYPG